MAGCAENLDNLCWRCFVASTVITQLPCKNLTASMIGCRQYRSSMFDYCQHCLSFMQHRRACRNAASAIVHCHKWAQSGKDGFCDRCHVKESQEDFGRGLCSNFSNPRVRCGRLCADAKKGFCASCLALVLKKDVSANAIRYFCKNAAASSSPCFNDFHKATSGLGRGFCFSCGNLWKEKARSDALATDCFARANDCAVGCAQTSPKKMTRKRKMLD